MLTYQIVNELSHGHTCPSGHPSRTALGLIFRHVIHISPDILVRQFLYNLNHVDGNIGIFMTEEIGK